MSFQDKPSETFLENLRKKKVQVGANFRVGRVTPNQVLFIPNNDNDNDNDIDIDNDNNDKAFIKHYFRQSQHI